MRILVVGGAGFVGSHVVDLLVERGHEVSVLDNLSTCWLRETPDGAAPRFRNPAAVYRKDPTAAMLTIPESIVVCSMRHPLERERGLYFSAFDGFVVQTVRLVANLLEMKADLKRVVVASTDTVVETDRRKVGPAAFLARCLNQALVYWHRPPNLGIYFVHLPELRGERRLPEAGDPGPDAPPVEEAAELLASMATDGKHRMNTDLWLGDPQWVELRARVKDPPGEEEKDE